MIKKVTFTTYAELIDFIAQEELNQFAVVRQSESEIELAFVVEQEEQPLQA